jgi:uncharacterized membrane protein
MNTRDSTSNYPPSVAAATYSEWIREQAAARGSKMPRDGLKMSAAQGSIVVNAPIGSVYRQWLRVEDLPKFMTAVKEVQKLDANHFCIAIAYNGKRHEGVLEVMLRVPERRLAWRVLAGKSSSNHLAAGVVSFTSRSDRSTCVTLKVSSSFGGSGTVSRRVARYLQNFERLVEERIGESAGA